MHKKLITFILFMMLDSIACYASSPFENELLLDDSMKHSANIKLTIVEPIVIKKENETSQQSPVGFPLPSPLYSVVGHDRANVPLKSCIKYPKSTIDLSVKAVSNRSRTVTFEDDEIIENELEQKFLSAIENEQFFQVDKIFIQLFESCGVTCTLANKANKIIKRKYPRQPLIKRINNPDSVEPKFISFKTIDENQFKEVHEMEYLKKFTVEGLTTRYNQLFKNDTYLTSDLALVKRKIDAKKL